MDTSAPPLLQSADFWDPYLYRRSVGLSPRFDEVYRRLVNDVGNSRTVLELGCGIGNVLLPIARDGHRVVGVDSSSAMLKEFEIDLAAADENVRGRTILHLADATNLPEMPPVDIVIAPNDFVANLLVDSELEALFVAVRSLLSDDGVFFFDVSPFELTRLGQLAAGILAYEQVHGIDDIDDTGRRLRTTEQTTYDPMSGVLEATFRYELLSPEGVSQLVRYRLLREHPRTLREYELLLRLCGFSVSVPVELLRDSPNLLLTARPN